MKINASQFTWESAALRSCQSISSVAIVTAHQLIMISCQSSLDTKASAQSTFVPKLITDLLAAPIGPNGAIAIELALPDCGMTIAGVTIFARGVAGESMATVTFGGGL